MNARDITIALTMALLPAAAARAQPEGGRPRPVAMVLAVRGAVQVAPSGEGPHRAAVEELLYEKDTFTLPAGASATIAVLGAGVRQTLRGPGAVAIGPKGAAESPLVDSKALPRAIATTMKGVQPGFGDARKAGVAARAGAPQPSPPLAPVNGSTVDTVRPTLSWSPRAGVRSYLVTLGGFDGQPVWKVETAATRLIPARNLPELKRGEFYRWSVTDPAGREVTSGSFHVAGAEESAEAAELKPLALSRDPGEVFAAAKTYDRLGLVVDAVYAAERAVALAPDEPAYRDFLAACRSLIPGQGPGGPPRVAIAPARRGPDGGPPPEHFAANLGIFFEEVPLFGARLTQDAPPGTPAAQRPLERGDMLVLLDGAPIFGIDDVRNHADVTKAVFINVRNGLAETFNFRLPPAVLPVGAPDFAPDFGVRVELVPLIGARLTRDAAPGTPAARRPLERGDMLILLDGIPLRNPNDVAAHVGQTPAVFVNSRTGLAETFVFQLPAR